MAGWGKRRRGERGGREGSLAATVSAEETAEAKTWRQSWDGPHCERVFLTHKRGTISNKYVTPLLSCNCSFLFRSRKSDVFYFILLIFFWKGETHHFGFCQKREGRSEKKWKKWNDGRIQKLPKCHLNNSRVETMSHVWCFQLFTPLRLDAKFPPWSFVKVERWWQTSEQKDKLTQRSSLSHRWKKLFNCLSRLLSIKPKWQPSDTDWGRVDQWEVNFRPYCVCCRRVGPQTLWIINTLLRSDHFAKTLNIFMSLSNISLMICCHKQMPNLAFLA